MKTQFNNQNTVDIVPDAKRLAFDTRTIHAGQVLDPTTNAVMTPIYANSTYVHDSPGVHKGFDYSRTQNPTRFAFERCAADLEEGHAAFAFASGMAAVATTLELIDHGSHVIVCDDLYGGSYRLFENVRRRTANLDFTYVNPADLAAIEAAVRPTTRMIWIESPSNPLLRLADLRAVAEIAKRRGLISVIDNTFASPYCQRPLTFGFDVVLHSITKYINGHSDVIGGLVVTGDNRALEEQMRYLQNAIGAIAGPFDCFLALRGLKTLAIRMERHCQNAQRVAEWLEKRSDIERVAYPGLKSHPQHELAIRQMDAFGAIISAVISGGEKRTVRFLESCELFLLAESLGGVESLIEHPATMTHASIPAEQRAAIGIDDGLVRISIGIENAEDLIADLDQALRRA
jgi:cystathionine gamma-lyase